MQLRVKKRIMHSQCNMTAFFYMGDTSYGKKIDGAYAELLDGSFPKNGDYMFCGSCGKAINYPESELQVETLQ